MTRNVNRLSARKVKTLTTPGMHADGGGLHVRISAGKKAGKRRVFLDRGPMDGKRCEIGFGGISTVSLPKARRKADEARALIADGKVPMAARQAAERIPTFGELADRRDVSPPCLAKLTAPELIRLFLNADTSVENRSQEATA